MCTLIDPRRIRNGFKRSRATGKKKLIPEMGYILLLLAQPNSHSSRMSAKENFLGLLKGFPENGSESGSDSESDYKVDGSDSDESASSSDEESTISTYSQKATPELKKKAEEAVEKSAEALKPKKKPKPTVLSSDSEDDDEEPPQNPFDLDPKSCTPALCNLLTTSEIQPGCVDGFTKPVSAANNEPEHTLVIETEGKHVMYLVLLRSNGKFDKKKVPSSFFKDKADRLIECLRPKKKKVEQKKRPAEVSSEKKKVLTPFEQVSRSVKTAETPEAAKPSPEPTADVTAKKRKVDEGKQAPKPDKVEEAPAAELPPQKVARIEPEKAAKPPTEVAPTEVAPTEVASTTAQESTAAGTEKRVTVWMVSPQSVRAENNHFIQEIQQYSSVADLDTIIADLQLVIGPATRVTGIETTTRSVSGMLLSRDDALDFIRREKF